MPFEIERKFLVKEDLIPDEAKSVRIVQAYLCADPERTVRVRIAGDEAFITIKGAVWGHSRLEFEYPIPLDHAKELIWLAVSPPIEKTRKEIFVEGKKWEVDFFEGANKGLIIAEIELKAENEDFVMPEWIAKEVSGDSRYYNSRLSAHPFSQW